jgi:hypothetical protein
MKSIKFLPVLLALSTVTAVSNAVADRTKTVTVINNTSLNLMEFYASPSANSGWDTTNNLLAGQTLGPGQSATITITDGVSHCHYDLMAVSYGSAQFAYQYSVNTCEGATWSVSASD